MEKIAYTVTEVVLLTSIGETKIKEALASGALRKRYPSTKPVVLAKDLATWLDSLPTEDPRS